MELRHLQYFLMVAREGTISGAAHALHLSQPSLSRQMQELEAELGVKLFDRGNRQIELTAAGMRLRRRAEEIVDLVGRTESEVRVSDETLTGEIRIGSGETPAIRLVADVIAELQSTYPLLHFALHSGNAQDVRERLDDGLVDFGIFIGDVDLTRYESLTLPAHDRWGVFMRSDDPLAQREVIRPGDLDGLPLILSMQGARELAAWLHRDAAELDVVATYNLLYNAIALARARVGYVVSLAGIVDPAVTPEVTFRPLEPTITAPISIAWKRYRTFSPAAEVFQQTIRERWG